MTPAERQALREKHKNYGSECLSCSWWTRDDGHHEPYPCDVIKVLDAWEEQNKVIHDAINAWEESNQ